MPPLYTPTAKKKRRPEINEVVKNWATGYVSYADAIRANKNSFLDMTNMELVQDGIARIRPGTTRYGVQPLGRVRGVGTYTDSTSPLAKPTQWQITLQVIDGKCQVAINRDGGQWQVIGGDYDEDAWATFCQSNNRVYISNGVDKMSYFDIESKALVDYTPIAKPTGVTVSHSNLSGDVVTYRVRVSANNNVGESQASDAVFITVGEYRNAWNPTNQSITIECPLVEGADSYNFYIGTSSGNEQYLGNVPKPSTGSKVKFKDNNRAALNPFKVAPEGDSTDGPVLKTMIASAGQLFGVGDANNKYRMWYSGTGDKSGDFSPFNGGGWVDINLGGDSLPVSLKQFRDGTGQSAITILTKGAAGRGEVFHQSFMQQNIGDYTISYPAIIPANGQSGTYSAMAVVEANNDLHYPTGTAFKTTGTKANMVNILVTSNTSDPIAPDLQKLNLGAMDGAVGMEYENRIFWCLPVGADYNNEIWVQDLSRRGAWILRWTLAAEYMWLYEDSNGRTHHCVLVDGKILEFNRNAGTTDDGAPFRTRLAGNVTTFDESGLQMASIEMMRFLLLRPKGDININIFGLGEDGEAITALASERVAPEATPTGWGDVEWSEKEWGYELGELETISKSMLPVPIEIDEVLSQLSWDISTNVAGCDYTLNSTLVNGQVIPGLYYGDD